MKLLAAIDKLANWNIKYNHPDGQELLVMTKDGSILPLSSIRYAVLSNGTQDDEGYGSTGYGVYSNAEPITYGSIIFRTIQDEWMLKDIPYLMKNGWVNTNNQ